MALNSTVIRLIGICNPLSHTMTTSVFLVTINGKPAAEFHINALIAARLGIPVICVTGDSALCELVHEFNPNIQTVAVNRGNGNGVESMHPLDACEAIKEAVAKAMKGDIKKCLPKMPKKFEIAITYREHHAALRHSCERPSRGIWAIPYKKRA